MTNINKSINQTCIEIKTLSSYLLQNFTDDRAVEIIDQRSMHFKKLNDLAECLPGKKIQMETLDSDTRKLISDVIEYDIIIKDKITHRMNELSEKMNNLYKNSRATAAYISQKK